MLRQILCCLSVPGICLVAACSEPQAEHFVTITVGGLPQAATSIEIQPVIGRIPAVAPLRFDSLQQTTTQGEASLLLRLSLDLSGPLIVAVAARSDRGCLLATGFGTAALLRGAPALALRVGLSPIAGRDAACKAGGPAITEVTLPAEGPLPSQGGTEMVVRGFGLHPQAKLTILGVPPAEFQWRSPLEMSAVMPPLPGHAGPAEIAVENPDGGRDARGDLLSTYLSKVQFDAPQTTTLGSRNPFVSDLFPMTLVDLNGDGRKDLVARLTERPEVSPQRRHSVSVSLATGDPDRPFAAPTNYYLPGRYDTTFGFTGIASGDINGDGKPDLLLSVTVAYDTGIETEIRLLLNQGDGLFPSDGGITVNHAAVTGNSARYRNLAVGDLNGDGRPDLAVGQLTSRFQIFLNQGGSLVFARDYNLRGTSNGQATDLRIADMDLDGFQDIVAAAGPDEVRMQMWVFFGTGDGRLPDQHVQVGLRNPLTRNGLEVGDVDADGRPDVVLFAAAANGGTQVALLRNLGKGFFAPEEYYTLPGVLLGTSVLGDLNGDGLLDLASLYSIGVKLRVDLAIRKRSGGFESIGQFEGLAGQSAPLIADVTADRRADVLGLVEGPDPTALLSVLRSNAQ